MFTSDATQVRQSPGVSSEEILQVDLRICLLVDMSTRRPWGVVHSRLTCGFFSATAVRTPRAMVRVS
jgi:hypothetical protein